MRFSWIDAQKANHSVPMMCRLLGVSRSGFYAWLSRPESARSRSNRLLDQDILRVHGDVRGAYGSPRMVRALRKEKVFAGRHRVARAMRRLGLMARRRKRFVVTTRSDHPHAVAPDRVGRGFWPVAPNVLWATDITYLRTGEGWLYLAVVLDLFSRKAIGWSMAARMDADLVLRALDMALLDRKPARGLIHHSDRGSQYACGDYVRALTNRGLVPSMSRKGNCWDNAVVESFFASLKAESEADRGLPTRQDARAETFRWLTFYNRTRMHSQLEYVSPTEFEYAAAKMGLAS